MVSATVNEMTKLTRYQRHHRPGPARSWPSVAVAGQAEEREDQRQAAAKSSVHTTAARPGRRGRRSLENQLRQELRQVPVRAKGDLHATQCRQRRRYAACGRRSWQRARQSTDRATDGFRGGRQEAPLPTIRRIPQPASPRMQIDPTVFKAYDIRGVVGKNSSTRPLPSTWAVPSAARRWPPAKRPWRWGATGACRGRRWWRR
jgi:hypothetical protein